MRDKILCTKPYYHRMRDCMAVDYIRIKGFNTVSTQKCKSKPVSEIMKMGKKADIIWNFPEHLLKEYAKKGVWSGNVVLTEKDGITAYVKETE